MKLPEKQQHPAIGCSSASTQLEFGQEEIKQEEEKAAAATSRLKPVGAFHRKKTSGFASPSMPSRRVKPCPCVLARPRASCQPQACGAQPAAHTKSSRKQSKYQFANRFSPRRELSTQRCRPSSRASCQPVVARHLVSVWQRRMNNPHSILE